MNPFLTGNFSSGKLTSAPSPLHTLQFPNVTTQIVSLNKHVPLTYTSAASSVSSVLQANTTAPSESGSLFLNINYSEPTTPVYSSGARRVLPRNLKEAHDMLDMISDVKSSKSRPIFTTEEIRTIAKNLNIPVHGKKGEIVARIRKAVSDYMSS